MRTGSLAMQQREKEEHKKTDREAKDTKVLGEMRKKTGGSKNNGKGGGTKKGRRKKNKHKPDRKYQQYGLHQEEVEDCGYTKAGLDHKAQWLP
ncbi:MAG: hypothetical protein FE78DRAFT_28183 [Acidomyces sp. 'richmondensis']|nr:MAG: hypothetical protein FE78DRAFT_28183 [Acidomyces sp. 'richmondensis']